MKNISKLLLTLLLTCSGLITIANEQVDNIADKTTNDVAIEAPAAKITKGVNTDMVNSLQPISAITTHPIELQETACRTNAQNPEQTIDCLAKSITNWSYEIAKYYSLLHKKLKGDEKTAIYESQKYWNLYKNNDFKVINALYDEEQETVERLICQVEQKRDILKNRAQTLHSYYVQSFPETENPDAKIPVNTVYKPDNFIIRALRHIGF